MKSFISYLGGKSLLTRTIIPKIAPHTCYCEVFAGAAWMLFKKEESKVEIINDINTDLITLYRVVKHHLDEFIRYFRWILVSRDEFERFRKEDPDTLTDIQKAVRFYYLLRTGYASRIPQPVFSLSPTRPSCLNLLRIEEELSMAHLRLSRVYIDNLPYEKMIKKADRENTFFYIDPPYCGCEDDYGKGLFQSDDFANLAIVLKEIKGSFIMSINDIPWIRDIYKEFYISEVATTYMCGGGNKKKKAAELLISNYKLPE